MNFPWTPKDNPVPNLFVLGSYKFTSISVNSFFSPTPAEKISPFFKATKDFLT